MTARGQDKSGPYSMPAIPPARDPWGDKRVDYEGGTFVSARSTIDFGLDLDGKVIQINGGVWQLRHSRNRPTVATVYTA